jgi:hypothetical protein
VLSAVGVKGVMDPVLVSVGEQLLAVTGVTAAIEPGPLKVTKAQLRAAAKWPDRAKVRMAEAVARDKPAKSTPLAPFDYAHWLEILPPPPTDARLMENVAGWPDQTLAGEYARALGTAWGYLQTIFPLRTIEHLSGPENVQPPDVSVTRFRRLLGIVEDPMSAIDRLEQGELLSDEVAALKAAYPALTAFLRATAIDELVSETARQRAKDKDWNLPRRKDVMLRRLLDQPKGSVAQASTSDAQKLYAEQRQQGEQQTPEKPASKGLASTDAELTSSQRQEANH